MEEMQSAEIEEALQGAYDRYVKMVENNEPLPPDVAEVLSKLQVEEGPEDVDRVYFDEPPDWQPAEGWNSTERLQSLREAEARGELRLTGEGGNLTIVYDNVEGVLDHLNDVLLRRPELLQQRFDELLQEDAEVDDEAMVAEADAALQGGPPMTLSKKLKDFLQRYQQYLEPSFRNAMIAAQVSVLSVVLSCVALFY